MLLITGASGFVGQHLLKHLNTLSPAVIDSAGILPIYNTTPITYGAQLDLSDPQAVSAFFGLHEISAIIHLAAEARPGICESDPKRAWKSNVAATNNLLTACEEQKPYFLYVSTDMVFRGDVGWYGEMDTPDPVNMYGRTKAEAEGLVQKYPGQWCIVRPSLIYGAPTGEKTSFLSWMIDALKTRTGNLYLDETRTPVWVDDLVQLLAKLVQLRHPGIVHAGGLQPLSRVEFAEIAANVWEIRLDQINTIELGEKPENAWRPRNVCLKSDTAHALHKFHAVEQALQKIRNSSTL